MSYEPFLRGAHPTGVVTVNVPSVEGRTLETEVWYPAAAAHRGDDLDPGRQDGFRLFPGLPESKQSALRDVPAAPGRFPLLIFSHGHGSHRRQSTFLCAHLASHGYVVAAPDHTGNTIVAFMQAMAGGFKGLNARDYMRQVLAWRPADILAVKGHLADRPGLVPAKIDHDHLGLFGHSLGGWTTLAATEPANAQAAAVLCPAGGPHPRWGNSLADALLLPWSRVVPALVLACDKDSLLPLDGIRVLAGRLPSATRMFVLENSDHFHVCDNPAQTHDWIRSLGSNSFLSVGEQMAPFAELCSGEAAHDWARSAVLTHFDAFIANHAEAKAALGSVTTPESSRAAR